MLGSLVQGLHSSAWTSACSSCFRQVASAAAPAVPVAGTSIPAAWRSSHQLRSFTASTAAWSKAGSKQAPPPEAAESQLHVSVEPLAAPYEGISVITLQRPSARNAIGKQLLRELSEALDILRQERSTRCVVVRSTVDGIFCAGADLKERAAMTQAETAEFVSSLRTTMTRIQGLPMPVVSAIEGFALGGGAELALATDIRVASSTAVFAFPEAQLGIMPGAGGTQRLPRLVGVPRAKELIFTGKKVKADEAFSIGLIDHLVEEGGAYDRALAIAQDIAKSAPLSLRMAKAAINNGMDVDLSTALKMEEAFYAQLIPTKDRLEGLRAFAEKRSPVYKGE